MSRSNQGSWIHGFLGGFWHTVQVTSSMQVAFFVPATTSLAWLVGGALTLQRNRGSFHVHSPQGSKPFQEFKSTLVGAIFSGVKHPGWTHLVFEKDDGSKECRVKHLNSVGGTPEGPTKTTRSWPWVKIPYSQ